MKDNRKTARLKDWKLAKETQKYTLLCKLYSGCSVINDMIEKLILREKMNRNCGEEFFYMDS